MKAKPLFSSIKKNSVLVTSIGLLVLFCLFAFFKTTDTNWLIDISSLWVRNTFGYFYLYLGLGCLIFLIIIALSPIGSKKLGAQNSKPEYSNWSWIAMLYSAGMGSGILLRAVQEPVFMQQNTPISTGLNKNIIALEFTFYQWGFTAWAFYGLFAMVMGYALFVKNKKVRISETISDTIRNTVALKTIDILTILTTLFGLIAAISLGATQINGGLEHLLNTSLGFGSVLVICFITCTLACYSAWKGVNKGIKILSKGNIIITLILLLYIFINSNMLGILSSFSKATLHYVIDIVQLSLAIGNYNPGIEFLTDWTFYYWAFWIAWAPFTGIFIARISKGRTIRQLLLGVLFIPSLGTFFWFSVFGYSAFEILQSLDVGSNEFSNVFTSIFAFLEHYPMATLLNTVTIVLLVSFLITSIDSAIFVLSMFSDNGNPNPNKRHRLLWAIFIFLTAACLLLLATINPSLNILSTVQKLLIITSLPFSFFMVIMSVFFIKQLRNK